MEIVNNTTSVACTNEYESKNKAKQTDEYSMKMETSKSNDRVLGIGTLGDKNSNIRYGMRAEYAENYSETTPVIKVVVQKLTGKEEYNININDIDPRNATEIEMFALCNYADAKGIGTGGKFGSWQTLNYYRDNASHNGYFIQTDETDLFESVRQDWMTMVQVMLKDYMEAGLYKQSLAGKALLEVFAKYVKSAS